MTSPTHIHTSGGLITAAFIENIREPGSRQRGVEPASFALPATVGSPRSGVERESAAPKSQAAIKDTIATAWELLLERWDAVRNALPLMDASQVRARWLLPLFQLLDFQPVYLRADTVLDPAGKLRYPLSHRGWPAEGAPVIHMVSPSQSLDARPAGPPAARKKSPHDMLQAFLNTSPSDHWAILTNGILLRLLRDYHHTFTKGYVEFDLESIFETRNYGDFRALYRLCHASRFLPPPSPSGGEGGRGDEGETPLERFYKDSIATGVKVGEDLRGQVRQAIETLGNGFLDGELIGRLQGDEALCRRYYGEILHIIYRLLFLLFAEQRGMLPGRDSLYAETYSIARLRARAEDDLPGEDGFSDLWAGLLVTFRMVRQGVPALGVFGYDGMLFEDDAPLSRTFRGDGRGGQRPEGEGSLLAGRSIGNSSLLRAIRALTLVEREGMLQRISYADLGVEELGSIYESLLDFTPRVTARPEVVNGREVPPHTFFLDPRGSERKTTGSYYTHPSLVNELCKSALLPVARDRLAAAGLPVIEEKAIGEGTSGLLADYAGLSAEQRAAGERALLSLRVCDPAAGSGHFLVKANNALGAELARVRSGDEYPSEAAVQAAKRDVLAHCLYAVDLNPMAVELCKVSLWINASVRDRPLSFLDHHIRCGNSLIGATPKLLAEGIPAEAFAVGIAGDDPDTAKKVRARNRQERRAFEEGGGFQMGLKVTVIETPDDLRRWAELNRLAEAEPQAARERYVEYLTGDEARRRKLEADFWTAAFFWPMPKGTHWAPTFDEFLRLREQGPRALPAEQLAQVEALAEAYGFFHWHLAFPDIFERSSLEPDPHTGYRGGFDVVLGNPPWERLQFEERTFFEHKRPEIYREPNQAKRWKMISDLREIDSSLYSSWSLAQRSIDCEAHFLRGSGRFPLSAVDKFNLYAVFLELVRTLYNWDGRGGLIVKAGYVTDKLCSPLFADTLSSGDLVSIVEFENRLKLFTDVHGQERFALVTLGRHFNEAKFSFDNLTLEQSGDIGREIHMSYADVVLLSPNTKTCPKFPSALEFEITRKCYENTSLLVQHEPPLNEWALSIDRYINISDFSDEIVLAAQLNIVLPWGFRSDHKVVPLYEGKLIQQYDHRYATYSGNGICAEVIAKSPDFRISFERYLPTATAVRRNPQLSHISGLLALRDITNRTNERGVIAAIIPPNITDYTLRIARIDADPLRLLLLLSAFNSFVFDYLARQRIGGTHLSNYILEQTPSPPPKRFTSAIHDIVIPRALELTYTAWDLQPFAQDVLAEVGPATWARWFAGAPVHTGPPPAGQPPTPAPFVWDEARRARLRAELDALYAHLYGLTRDELAYILDTFPIVRRKDEARWGEYRTKRMVLEMYEQVAPVEGASCT